MGSMSDDALKAVFLHANGASTFKTAMTGGIFFERAWSSGGSSHNSFPFAVYFQVSDVPEFTYNTEIGDMLFQWTIVDNTASSGLTLLDGISKLHSRFDEATFTIANWILMRCTRTGHLITPVDDNGMRMSASTYRITAHKS